MCAKTACLCAFNRLFYAGSTRGSKRQRFMQRLTARLLLLICVAGSFVPLALQASAIPPHACCLRKAMHRCHEAAAADRHEPVASAPGGCHHNCYRGVTTSQSAHPEPPVGGWFAPDTQNHDSDFQSAIPDFNFLSAQSTRAPPQFILA